jgi:hypothetical protein
MVIVDRDPVIYSKGYGYRDLENKLPATETTLFPIASNTKLNQLRDKFMQDFYYKRNNNEEAALPDTSSLSSVILKECVVCMSGVADGVLMPCGHSGICYECAIQMLQKEEQQGCHLCRENIE